MAVKFDARSGHAKIVGSIPEGGTKVASAREIYNVFSGPDGDRAMTEIANDFIRRGLRVPIAIKAMRHVKDKETREATIALNNVEQLRRKRLWTDMAAGRISEAEYQKQLREGSIV